MYLGRDGIGKPEVVAPAGAGLAANGEAVLVAGGPGLARGYW